MPITRTTGFVQLRRGLFEHVMNQQMSITDVFVFTAILVHADPASGVWIGSAAFLADLYKFSERTARDCMNRLEKTGYIKRFLTIGRHTVYPILVHNFLCTDGAGRGTRLNAEKSTSYNSLVYESGSDGAGTVPGECRDGAGTVPTLYREQENKRTENREQQRETPGKQVSPPSLFGDEPPNDEAVVPEPPDSRSQLNRELTLAVKEVFHFYLQKTGKNPNTYAFTDARKQKGLSRLRELLKRPPVAGDVSVAKEWMKACVVEMCLSKHHQGDNKFGRKFLDWNKHLFPSEDKVDYWLELNEQNLKQERRPQ